MVVMVVGGGLTCSRGVAVAGCGRFAYKQDGNVTK